MAKVTIKDIAKELGVSYTTVSRALTERAGVSPVTRQRVIEAARKMGYQPNIMARALVTQRTDTIGLLVPDITNPFSAEVARGVENAAQEYGLTLILGDTNHSPELEDQYIKRLGSNRVDGLLVMPVSPHAGRAIIESSIQSVIINSKVHSDISFVTVDHEYGGYIATRHLLELGFRRVAIVGGRITTEAYCDRLLGYRKALDQFGIPYDESLIFTDSVTPPSTAVTQILDKFMREGGPDAFFATNDVIALNLLRELKSPVLKKHTGIGIIGFDDIPIASFPEIELSTVAQQKYLLGRTAVEILVQEMHNKKREPIQRIILSPELIVRRTVRE